ncbi:CRISPR system precrRNA processing endoribonuclease RAMP protein Cas6 [Deltaproteobacteria bacterium TL4]
MLNTFKSIPLIRYLIVWKTNNSFASLLHPNAEISKTLGSLIAERLSSQEAKRWKKFVAGWQTYQNVSDASEALTKDPDLEWPLSSVISTHSQQRHFGEGECLVWELKLFGDYADHAVFLETILPAMEEAGYTNDPRWKQPRSLWGRFDIDAVYIAKGRQWEPLVEQGKLNMRLSVDSLQWNNESEISFSLKKLKKLSWQTPFLPRYSVSHLTGEEAPLSRHVLCLILEDLLERWSEITHGKRYDPQKTWSSLSSEETTDFLKILEMACAATVIPSPKSSHSFSEGQGGSASYFLEGLLPELLPYLELASIFHVGRQTHFGHGAFFFVKNE